ncbi:type II secretion system protein [Parasphingorhabdus sp.]|uniref:type IV pilus modification PilV family protein n=1 Tax=Parasphingorhabdus sp. TaxID=2709688 RepID=UPI0032652F46
MKMQSENGFTLIEVLVALIVTSFLVTILMDGAVTAKSRQVTQILHGQALAIAKSHIDDLRDISGVPSRLDGTENHLTWQLQETEIARDPRGAFVLVEVSISAGNQDKPALVTLQKRYLKNLTLQ